MKNPRTKYTAVLALTAILLAAFSATAMGQVNVSYQYNLSNFWGTLPTMLASLAVDLENNEVFVLERGGSELRVFNEQGMELHSFGNDLGAVNPVSVTVGEDGDLLVLSNSGGTWEIQRRNYRGEYLSVIKTHGFPKEFSSFLPTKILYRNGLLYLDDTQSMLVAAIKLSGEFVRGIDVYELLFAGILNSNQLDEKARKRLQEKTIDIPGFSVDGAGNLYFTVPTLSTAYRLGPNGEVEEFGRAGSSTGKFGVIAGIAADDQGNIFVSDRLRCVVLMFDKYLKFQTEFGYRGGQPRNLIVPDDLVIDGRGYIYVSQAANRGVSVFRTTAAE